MDRETLRGLPKAELHLHLDGSVRPETAAELAAESGMALTLEEARSRLLAPERCRDQAELLRYFELPISLLGTAAALRRVAGELVEELVADGVTYVEIRWAPRLHLEGGLGVGEVIEAVAEGVEATVATLGRRAPVVALIVTAMRQHPPAANVELARTAAAFGPPVVGFDLAGPEATWPASPHAAAFRVAERGGLATTCHAGETPGRDRLREALDLGVRRIAHGTTLVHDAELMDLVRERDVTLDLCPTSNVQAGIVPDLATHPVAELHRAGISVTISTDDRTVSGVSLSEEMARTAAAVGLGHDELSDIALNGFRRGFAPSTVREPLLRGAERAWAARGAQGVGQSATRNTIS